MLTIEEALIEIVNGGQLTAGDAVFAIPLAELVEQGVELRADQRRALWRMLNRLGVQAQEAGEVRGSPVPLRPRNGIAVDLVPETSGPALGPRLAVRTPFKYKDVVKALPGRRWHGDDKYWSVPATPQMAEMLLGTFPDAYMDDGARALIDQHVDAAKADAAIEDGPVDPIQGLLTTAWPHQNRAYHHAHGRPGYMLAMQMGTGKTLVAIGLMVNANARQVLIQCPKSVLGVWAREFRVHSGDHFHVEVLTDGKRTVPQRAQRADWLLHECTCGRPHALVINYEAAYPKAFSDWALSEQWDYVVFDESHRIKAPTGAQSKFCARLRDRAKHRLALSGTPMAQTPLDIWAQFRALDPDVFGSSHTSFRYRYAVMGGWQGKQVIGMDPRYEQELADLYYSRAYEVGSEVLDLPPSTDVTRYCDLEPAARRVYKGLADDMYAEIGDSEVSTPNVLVKILRCMQVTGGSVPTDEGDGVEISTAKEQLLAEVLEEAGPHRPVAVFCKFIADLDRVHRIVEAMGLKCAELSGRQNDMTADAHMPDWADVIAVQIQAGGVGIDLTRASVGVYYSTGHSLSNYQQSRARLLRPGQLHPVLFVHLACSDTIDVEVMSALIEGKEVIDRVRARGKS